MCLASGKGSRYNLRVISKIAANMPRLLSRCKPLCLVLAVCGCPKRFDPRAEPALTSPDSRANDEYQLARSLLERQQNAEAAQRFATFVEQHPRDPLADLARVNQARALYLLGKCDQAMPLVAPLASQPLVDDVQRRIVQQKARLQEGLCAHRRGDAQLAAQRLSEIAEQIAPGDDANELHAVLADVYLQRGDMAQAEREFQRFSGYATPGERAYIAEQAKRFCQSRPGCLERFSTGDTTAIDGPRRERGQLKVGLVLPLSGKSKGLGERALRGVLLGLGLVDGDAGKIELEVADTRSDPKRVAELVRALGLRGVDVLIGSPDKGEAMVAASVGDSAPLVSLVAEDGSTRAGLFHAVAGRAAAARALAEHGLSVGKRAAILAPDSTYGRTLGQAFVERWQQGGGVIVAELKYKESATTFVHEAKKLRAVGPEVLFVAAPAGQLQLIAPQLASTGVVAMANVPAQGKPAQLLAMADGLQPQQLLGMGKYIQQAVLGVLFASAAEDAATVEMCKRYRAAFGEEPSLLDAVSFDAATATRRALEQVGDDPTAVGRSLVAQRFAGATGEVAFSDAGQRAGKVRLFVVRGAALQPLP